MSSQTRTKKNLYKTRNIYTKKTGKSNTSKTNHIHKTQTYRLHKPHTIYIKKTGVVRYLDLIKVHRQDLIFLDMELSRKP